MCPLLTKLSATICAILRARSLGLKTNDLSWDYAIAAIWGNVELGVGAIAAIMVLLRSYITFFRGRKVSTSPGTSAQTHTNTYFLVRRGWTRQHNGLYRAAELGSAFEDDEDSQHGLTSRGSSTSAGDTRKKWRSLSPRTVYGCLQRASVTLMPQR